MDELTPESAAVLLYQIAWRTTFEQTIENFIDDQRLLVAYQSMGDYHESLIAALAVERDRLQQAALDRDLVDETKEKLALERIAAAKREAEVKTLKETLTIVKIWNGNSVTVDAIEILLTLAEGQPQCRPTSQHHANARLT